MVIPINTSDATKYEIKQESRDRQGVTPRAFELVGVFPTVSVIPILPIAVIVFPIVVVALLLSNVAVGVVVVAFVIVVAFVAVVVVVVSTISTVGWVDGEVDAVIIPTPLGSCDQDGLKGEYK